MSPLLLKVVSWRVVSVLITCLVTFLFTESIYFASSFSLVLHTILVFSHYFFEKIWEKRTSSL